MLIKQDVASCKRAAPWFWSRRLYPLPAGRKALPLHYYSTNLTRFIGIKRSYDPGNFLGFEMGIPTR